MRRLVLIIGLVGLVASLGFLGPNSDVKAAGLGGQISGTPIQCYLIDALNGARVVCPGISGTPASNVSRPITCYYSSFSFRCPDEPGQPNHSGPPASQICIETLTLAISSVSNGQRLESISHVGRELSPRHPIAAGARYNSGNGHWEDPNNPNNYVTFRPELTRSGASCAGRSAVLGTQEISHNTMPVDAGASVDITVTQDCSNCFNRRFTAQIPVDTVAGAPAPIVSPPPTINPPIKPPIIQPTPIALTGTASCQSDQATALLNWTGARGADGVTVWRQEIGPSLGPWERVQGYSGLEAILTAFQDRNINPGATYRYQIEANTYAGSQTLSNVITLAVPDCTPPGGFTLSGQMICSNNQRVARVQWQAVPNVTHYQVMYYEEAVISDLKLVQVVGPGTTSFNVPLTALVGLVKVRVYATTPGGVSTSNDFVSSRENPCATTTPPPTGGGGTPQLPATIVERGTAQLTISGLPTSATWDRLSFPGLVLNGGRVEVGIESLLPPCDPNASCAPTVAYPNFELTESNAAIDLGALPELSGYSSFRISLVLHADPTQQQTPHIPSLKVSAKPKPVPPSPTVTLASTSRTDGQNGIDLVLHNEGPGSIELANTAPFRVTTLAGEPVYSPVGAAQVTSLGSGQDRRWSWDFRNDAGKSVPAGGYLVVLTYQTGGATRTVETRIDVTEARSEPPVTTGTVLDYGAKCDGRTDDTQAISAAIDAAADTGGNRVVDFPAERTCRMSSLIKDTNDLILDGNGVTIVSSVTVNDAAPVLGINGSGNIIRNFTIEYDESIDIASGQSAGTQGASLWLGSNGGDEPYARRAIIENNTIRNSPGDCILVTFAHDVMIRDNTCEGALGVGIFTGNLGDRVLIEGNSTSDTGDDGIFAETGPYAPLPQHELIIRGNTVTRSNAKGIGLSGAHYPTIADNTIDGTAGSGIVLESDETQSPAGIQGVTILGNTLRNIGFFNDYRPDPLGDRHGIRVVVPRYRVEDLTIANNTLEHVAMNGMAVNGVRDLTIDSNSLTKIGSSGLSLGFDRADDSRAVDTYVVSHNQIDGAGLNGIYLSKVFGGTVTQNQIRDYWEEKLGYGEAAIFFYRADTARHGQNSIENTNGAPAEIKIVDSRSITELDPPPAAATGPAKPAALPPVVSATTEPAGTDLSVPTSLDPSPTELRVIDDTPAPVTATGDVATPETVVAEPEIVTDPPAPAEPEPIDATPTDPAAPSLLPTPVATTLERGEGSTAPPAAPAPASSATTESAESTSPPDPDPASSTGSATPSTANAPDEPAVEDRTVFQRFVRWLLAIFQLEE